MKKLIISLIVIFLGFIVLYSIPTKTQSFDDIYEQKDEILASLQEFRKIPLNKIIIDDIEWEYLKIGKGKETILFLHGMTGSYDVWWQQINFLKSDYRIISVTYPVVDNLKAMGNALSKILEKERVRKLNIVGSSLGGFFTQYLLSLYPKKVKKAIFANTYPVNNIIKEDNKNVTPILKNAPEWMVMAAMRHGLYLDILPAANNSKILEAMMLEQFSGGLSQKKMVARYKCVIDKFEQSNEPDIPLLIIESDNDPLVKFELREMLKKVYSKAKVITLHNAGHFPYLSEPVKYNEILKSFLESEKDTLNYPD